MTDNRSKYQFYQEASLSQKLAFKMSEYSDYAGSDVKISDSIAVLNFLANFGLLDPNSPSFLMTKALLNELRKSRFATSDKVNEISKMGMQLPKAEEEYYG